MANKKISELTAIVATSVSDAASLFFGVDQGSTSFKFSLEQLGVALFGADKSSPAAVRVQTNGTRTAFYATASTGAANGTAFANAIAASSSGDTVELDPLRRYEPATGSGNGPAGLTNFTIKNGIHCRNSGTATYTRLLEADTCLNLSLENMVFDGEAGISAPTDTPPTHQVTNSNPAGSFSYLVSLVACHGTKIKSCQFRDHAGQELTNSSSLPYYQGAHAINIGTTCSATNVTDCQFYRIGYAGVADDGADTIISDCLFDDVQWHGVVVSYGNSKISNCQFQRLSATTLGYPGAIDINGATQIEQVDIDRCEFNFPYDFLTNTLGKFMLKVNNVTKCNVNGTVFKHGKNGPDGSATQRQSIRIVGDGVKELNITGSWLAGGIGHIGSGAATPKIEKLVLKSTYVNQTAVERDAILADIDELIVESCELRYSRHGVLGRSTSTRLGRLFRSTNSLWTSHDVENADVADAVYIQDVHTSIVFDSSNRIQTGIDGPISQHGQSVSFLNRKSDTDSARLAMSTNDNPTKKLFDSSLTGSFSHGTATSQSPPIRDIETRTSVPFVMTDANINIAKSNYQKRTLSGNETAALSASLTAADEGTFIRVLVINPSQAHTYSLPSTWDPSSAFTQPALDSFSIGLELVDNGSGTILPRFAGVI